VIEVSVSTKKRPNRTKCEKEEMKTIAFLALETCMESSISGPYDILSLASSQWAERFSDTGDGLFKLSIVSPDGLPVTCFNGMRITPHMGVADCRNPDIIFIPVTFGDREAMVSNRSLVSWLRTRNERGTILCAVCAGVFLVAQTRLLDGRTATTHWNLSEEFAGRYPDVILKKERMIVDEGDIITAGGVTAFIDLALYMAGRFGSPELSSVLSRMLLIDPARRLQTPYAEYRFNTSHRDRSILKAQDWMEENMTAPLSVPLLADRAGLGERTFARRFKKATGDTPLEYLQYLRIRKARSLLETTDEPVEVITSRTGYEDASSFRRLFKKATGLSPTAYRKKFGLGA
jgi:transcriptional regulator GlxA family with amidase domain